MNTPKIRFKGFTDDWEQRKVGDQMYIKSRIGWQALTKQEYLSEGDYYLITGTDIDETTHRVDLKRSYYVSKERYEMDSKIQVKEGDIIVTKDGTIGKVAMVTGLDKPATLNSHLFVLRDMSGKLDNHFLLHILNSHMFNHFVKSTKTGSTLTGLPQKTFVEFAFSCPKYEEQKLLSNYFDRLDHLITLHQRKCDETKQLKKFMLQKMFPKNGEKNPEIRFKGFTDDWEQRKLDTVAKFSKGSGYSKGDLIETGTPIILYGRLYTKYETSISDVDTYVEAKEGSVYSKGGEVIVPASGETAEDIARAATVDKSGILLGGDLNVVMPNEDINSAFLAISISNGNSQRELAKKAQGKSVVHIHNEEIRNLIVPFPIKAEQNRIVDYFSTLDHLITLHQRKCEKLKELKKFMLQNMFV